MTREYTVTRNGRPFSPSEIDRARAELAKGPHYVSKKTGSIMIAPTQAHVVYRETAPIVGVDWQSEAVSLTSEVFTLYLNGVDEVVPRLRDFVTWCIDELGAELRDDAEKVVTADEFASRRFAVNRGLRN